MHKSFRLIVEQSTAANDLPDLITRIMSGTLQKISKILPVQIIKILFQIKNKFYSMFVDI